MIVTCHTCSRALRVGLAHAKTYWEERAGLSDLAGTCPRNRINGAIACGALCQLEAMTMPEVFEEEMAEV